MNVRIHKLLSLILAVAMVVGMLPAAIAAEEPQNSTATEVATFAELQAALNSGGNITLMADIELTDTLTVPADATVTLNLNGKTISQTKECTASYEMIANNGSLTITGNGKISFTDTGAGDPDAHWGAYTIRNNGTLVVENGTIENLSAQN